MLQKRPINLVPSNFGQSCPVCCAEEQDLLVLGALTNLSIPRRLRMIGSGGASLESTMMKCQKCEVCYLWPMPSEEILIEHYQKASVLHGTSTEDQYQQRVFNPANRETVETLLSGLAASHQINREELASGWIVDIGCNAADFLFGFRCCGFESLLAVEPDEKVQAWNRQYVGCSTHVGMLNTIDDYYDGRCTLVALRDSLEHHLNPFHSIRKCFDLLAPGGILFLQVPNIKCRIATHNLEAFEWFEPDHLFYFDPCSIEHLLRQCGFSAIETETLSTTYDEQDHNLVSWGEPYSEDARGSIEAEKTGRVLRCFAIKNKADD